MPFRPGLTLAALLTAACAPDGTSRLILAPQAVTGPVQRQGACMPDRPCELTGTVTLERRTGDNSWAALSQGGGCAPLLLPPSTYPDARRWNGKHVRARGPALPEVMLLQGRDRWLSPSVCSESALMLYVDRMILAD